MNPEAQLRECLMSAIAAVHPERVLPPHVPDLPEGRLGVVGAGKASAAMASVLEKELGDTLIEGLVVTAYGHSARCRQVEVIEASHPIPNQTGALAARRTLNFASELGTGDKLVALMSGGGSSLLSLMPMGVSQEECAQMNRELSRSGIPIGDVNCIRRHLSRIAGGRLAVAAYPAKVETLVVSDAPGDDPVDVASCPTLGDPTTLETARNLINDYKLSLPQSLVALLDNPDNETIKPDDPRLAENTVKVIAHPKMALAAAAAHARRFGWTVVEGSDQIVGEARAAGTRFAEEAVALRHQLRSGDPPHLTLTGGRTSVTLPQRTSDRREGGRNVEFLMGFLSALGTEKGIYALAADTGGLDGCGDAAGAILTPTSHARAGNRLDEALRNFDGHGLFAALGDQVVTGPTLTNVNDFRAILVLPA